MVIELNERLTALVAKAAKKDGFINYKTLAQEGSARGDNYLGTITKVTVTDEDTNKSTNYIIKSAPANPEFRKFMPIVEAFNREDYVYNTVLTVYDEFLKEYNLKPFNCVTKLLESDMSIPELLLMPDMKSIGYVMLNRQEYMDLKHVKLVMKAYEKLHGLYYALKTLKPEKAKELYDNMAENFMTSLSEDANFFTSDLQNDKVRTCFRKEDVLLRERFDALCKDQSKRILDHMKPTAAGRFAVINHGDSWMNNMLFAYKGEDPQQPTDICLLDFQMSRIGSPALDLSYFIFTCTGKELRDQYYDDILQMYHDALQDLLQGFSLKVEDFLTMEELNEQMRLFSLYGITMTFGLSYAMVSNVDEIPEFQTLDLKEGTDLDELFKSLGYVSKNEHVYLERVRNVIIDCIQRGYM